MSYPIRENYQRCKDSLFLFEWIITHYTAYHVFLEQIVDLWVSNEGC